MVELKQSEDYDETDGELISQAVHWLRTIDKYGCRVKMDYL